MALIDMEKEVVRVRIVYDGLPQSGKTTTIRALEQKLATARAVRDLNDAGINWLEYQGGIYDHLPIACQILSTPSPQWQRRREFMLSQADAIVLVLDARPDALPLGLEYLRQLRNFLSQLPPPAPLFLIQTNFQDSPQALTIEKLHTYFIDPSIRIIESIPPDGLGVRETFVMAVRLVVERLNTLKQNFQLLQGTLALSTPDNWRNALEQHQPESEQTILSLLLDKSTPLETESETSDLNMIHADLSEVNLPNPETPLQWLFPAISTQALLQKLPTLEITLQPDDDWLASNEQWRLFSKPDWHYLSEKKALSALQQQIRWHTQALFGLPETRCLALSYNEHGWHLWQIVQRTASVTISNESVEEFVKQLLITSHNIHQTLQKLFKRIPLSQLQITYFDGQGNYCGRVNPTEKTLENNRVLDQTVELCLPLLKNAPFNNQDLLETLEKLEFYNPQFAHLFANTLL